MTRKECIDYIKSNGYGMEATKLARDYVGCLGVNYTNVPTEILQAFVASKENTKQPVVEKCNSKSTHKSPYEHEPLYECADTKVRKALIALAELYGHKDIVLKNLR